MDLTCGDARSRTYCYWLSPCVTPRVNQALYWPMSCRAALVAGTHDFTAFTPTQTEHVRFEVDARASGIGWLSRSTASCSSCGSRPTRSCAALVCILVGTMLEVAQGRRSVEDFEALLRGAPRERGSGHGPGAWPVPGVGALLSVVAGLAQLHLAEAGGAPGRYHDPVAVTGLPSGLTTGPPSAGRASARRGRSRRGPPDRRRQAAGNSPSGPGRRKASPRSSPTAPASRSRPSRRRLPEASLRAREPLGCGQLTSSSPRRSPLSCSPVRWWKGRWR